MVLSGELLVHLEFAPVVPMYQSPCELTMVNALVLGEATKKWSTKHHPEPRREPSSIPGTSRLLGL